MKTVLCRTCGKEMKQFSSKPKLYCSATCRSASWRLGTTSVPCFYCGCPAQSIDHIPPKSVRPFIMAERLQWKYPFKEVDACGECNGLLSDRPFWDLQKRKKFIKRALRWKYRRILALPEWTPPEKNELGYNLKTIVEIKSMNKRIVTERLAW